MTRINVNVISGPQTADILFQGPCCEKMTASRFNNLKLFPLKITHLEPALL